MRLFDAIQHAVGTGNDSATLGVSGIADLKRIEVGKFAKFMVPMDQPLPSDLRAHYGHQCPGPRTYHGLSTVAFRPASTIAASTSARTST